MKKFICLLTIIALTLTACGEEDIEGANKVTNDDNSVATMTVDAENDELTINEEPAKEEKNTEIDKKTDKKSNSDALVMFYSNATIEESVIIDEKDIKVTAKGLEYDRQNAYLNLLIENNTTSDLTFYSGTSGSDINEINHFNTSQGYMCCDVSAGMKANEQLRFDGNTLKAYGIFDIAEIKVGIYVKDSDYNDIISPTLVSIPTSIYESYDFDKDTFIEAVEDGIYESEFNASIEYMDNINKEENGILQKIIMLATNKSGERSVLLELENKTQETKYVVARNVSINGMVVYGSNWTGDEIGAESRRIMQFDIGNMIDDEYTNVIPLDKIGLFEFELAYYDSEQNEIGVPSKVLINTGEDEEVVLNDEKTIYDANGIIIAQLALTQDKYDKIYIPMVIKNNTDKAIRISDDYGSLSVNSFMVSSTLTGCSTIRANSMSIMAIYLYDTDQKDCGINSLEDLKNAQITVEIKNEGSRETIDKPILVFSYE